MKNKKIILNEQQDIAKNKIINWFSSIKKIDKTPTVDNTLGNIFVLAGFAGTGKTTLINYVIKNNLKLSKNDVIFITPTAKAASVLMQKGNSNVSTIHRLIYRTESKKQQIGSGEKIKVITKLSFIKRKSLDENYKLIVLDEVSMVSKNIMNDLLSFGVPILVTGDPGQLPPVKSEDSGLLEKPDATLTEIVRQAEDNAIIVVSKMARENKHIPHGIYNGGQVVVLNRSELSDSNFLEILKRSDQVICGLNKTRFKLNRKMREYLGYSGAMPNVGEKVICDQNNYEIKLESENEIDDYFLINGLICKVDGYMDIDDDLGLGAISVTPDFLTKSTSLLMCESNVFKTDEFKYDKRQYVYVLDSGRYAIKEDLFKKNSSESSEIWKAKCITEKMNERHALDKVMLNQFEYGYVISCHKSQGSEWDTVTVIDEHKAFKNEGFKWLYTAITRAKKKLIIIR